MAEVWDAYNKLFQKIDNVELIRGEPIPKGMFHLVIDIIVKHTDGTYLLTQRDKKKSMGGKWELSVGGSALRGETPLESAIRELQEETGLNIRDMVEIKRVVHEAYQTLYVEFLCSTACDKDSIVLQENETIDFKWIDKQKILDMNIKEFASSRTIDILKTLK